MNSGVIVVIFVLCYLALLMIIGWVAGRKTKDSADYMVAGRKMPLYMTTATLFATYVCGGTVMGGAGAAYSGGFFATIYDPFAAAIALVIAGLLFMKHVRELKIVSMGSFYRLRFGPTAGGISSLCMVPTYVLFATVQVMAIGKAFSALLGWDYMTMAFIGGILVIVYTYWGGMLAVAWTDFVQSLLLILGVVVLFPLALKATGGMANVKTVVPHEYFSFAPRDFTLVGILTYISMWVGCGLGNIPCPDLMQRAMVAKDGKTARRSGIIAGILMIGLGLLVVYIGVFGIYLADQGVIAADAVNQDPEMVVPLLAIKLMHPAILGLFLAGLLGAIMSSADSALFAPATILSNDLIRPIAKKWRGIELTDDQLKNYTKYAVLGIGVLAMLLGVVSDSLYEILILGFILLGNMLFFPLFLGMYWKKANEYGAIGGMLGGLITVLILRLIPGSPEWVTTMIPLVVSAVTMVVVTLATQKTCPPKPLIADDGEIIKWPELQIDQTEAR